jgi:SAM-dependent methyltransferase
MHGKRIHVTNELETFYSNWQNHRTDLVTFDNECAIRKIDTIVRNVPELPSLALKSAVDFGCGRGQALRHFVDQLKLERGYGFDFSAAAVDYAARQFGSSEVQFHRQATLDIDESIESMKRVLPGKADCVLLIDLLEHVPDCKHLVARLSEVATYFVIKLPVEFNLFENYFFRNKIYPSPTHYNGHLREFSANSVFYFIRELGLTPIAEGLYLYDAADAAPQTGLSWMLRVKNGAVCAVRKVLSVLLHKKLFLTVIGPGGYYCVATFNAKNVLNP